MKRAMLMAAGLGTRLKPYTETHPKALMPLLGIPIAQFALDSIARAGVDRVVANVHHHAEEAKAGLKRLDPGDMELRISDESDLLLGSAGGLRKAQALLGNEPFFLVNADVLCDVDLRELARTHAGLRSQRGVTMTLAVFSSPPASGSYREIFIDESTGLVTGFSPDLRSGRPFFIGSAALEPEALRDVPARGAAEFVPTVLEPGIRERKVGFHLTSGIWKDIGAPQLWLDAQLFLLRALETGRLPMTWLHRLERENLRMANEIWVSRASMRNGGRSLRLKSSSWAGPCYFSGPDAPKELGPNAVFYGDRGWLLT